MPLSHFTIALIIFLIPWQNAWEKEVDKKGIQVYTRKVDAFPIKAFKVTTIINGSMEDIIAVLTKIEDYKNWITNCSSASVIFEKDGQLYFHLEIELPFPVKDRDIVQSFEKIRLDSGTFELKIMNHPDIIERDENFIRMPTSNGKWTIKKIDSSQSSVTLEMQNDPGGSIPDWLINSQLKGSPFKTMLNLKNKFPDSTGND